MLDPYFHKVIALAKVAASFEQPSEIDWQAVERDLEVPLPADYKSLVSRLGTGCFGEFWLHNPVCTSHYGRLSRRLLMEFREWHERDALGIPLFPDADGYVWLGSLPNHMDLLLCPGRDSSAPYRLVWFEADGPSLHDIPMTLCQFLHDLYFGLLHTDWSDYVRGLVWAPDEVFFTPRPGVRRDAHA